MRFSLTLTAKESSRAEWYDYAESESNHISVRVAMLGQTDSWPLTIRDVVELTGMAPKDDCQRE
jgi:hypothetical protein